MSVYNGEKYLREAIDSILNQTFKDFEFIIIADGLTDDTPKILEGRINKNRHNVYDRGYVCKMRDHTTRIDSDS